MPGFCFEVKSPYRHLFRITINETLDVYKRLESEKPHVSIQQCVAQGGQKEGKQRPILTLWPVDDPLLQQRCPILLDWATLCRGL